MDHRQKTGKVGERVAQSYLRSRGYRIVETNFRCPEGELDIIAQKDDWLAFVEVRTRSSSGFGTPEESVTQAKAERLVALAQAYLLGHENLPSQWRIDLVAVELGPGGKVSRVEHIENVVS